MERIITKPIEEDLKESYLDYAMSVIVGRAIPDIRDGLKPVHRRILYAMHQLGNVYGKPYKKSARIVGETLGKFHPHGDSAIYDALVRMAQPFSLRYPLVDGQGNMGSIDGDKAAAMRYTEVRLAKITAELLQDIEKNTIDWEDNFDGTIKEPVYLPSKLPNLLINGTTGIAVGMATNIPPHNLNEILDASIAIIEGKDEEEILRIVKGPDFPTGGIIVGKRGIEKAYRTGRGTIKIRAKTEFDEKRHAIIIREIPYEVTKTSVIDSIVNAVKNKKIEGITGIHDRSDKRGMEVIIEVKKSIPLEIMLNQLFVHTNMQVTYGIINLAIRNRQPKIFTLYEMINEFVLFRKDVVTKRSKYELNKAEERAHVLEGLLVAIKNIEDVVDLLKKSENSKIAKEQLMKRYSLSERQTDAILEMRLSRLIALEIKKIESEHAQLMEKIKWLKEILSNEEKLMGVVKKELEELKEKYGDGRRTELIEDPGEFNIEDLIPNEEVVLILTERGYIKRVKLTEYRTQHRGGKGIIGIETKEGDRVKDVIITKAHNNILFFTENGKVFKMKAYEIPEGSRYSQGKYIYSLINTDGAKITSWIFLEEFDDDRYFIMLTKKGIIKKTKIKHFKNIRRDGIKAIKLREGDQLVEVRKSNGEQEIILATRNGMSIRFKETEIREVGRDGIGVIGIRLRDDDEVVGSAICNKPDLLTITVNGYGKRTKIEDYRVQGRGGYGIINLKTTEKTGKVVGIRAVEDEEELLVITSKGKTIRTPIKGIAKIGRNTQGVRIIRMENNEKVAGFSVIRNEES